MRRLSLVLFSCLSFLLFPLAPANAAQGPSALPVPIPQMPPLGAKAYVLMDYQSGQILVQKNPNEHMAPASTTKLMTAYVVFQELKSGRITLDTKFRVSEKAWRQGGSRMFLKLGSEVTVNNLLQGLLIPSGNDAAMTLAQGIAGTSDAFVSLMNSYAKHLGLTNTHYKIRPDCPIRVCIPRRWIWPSCRAPSSSSSPSTITTSAKRNSPGTTSSSTTTTSCCGVIPPPTGSRPATPRPPAIVLPLRPSAAKRA
ncbi:MAG: serine hydrolase [Acidihalobacter sp.]